MNLIVALFLLIAPDGERDVFAYMNHGDTTISECISEIPVMVADLKKHTPEGTKIYLLKSCFTITDPSDAA